jgi:hypothetical protein
MQQVLDRAAELYEHLPEDGKEVFYSRLVKEVDHTLERYAFFVPQESVQPDEAVEKLQLTPPVEDEEVPPAPVGAVVGLTTTPDLPSYKEEGVVDLKGEAVEGTTEESEEEKDEEATSDESEEGTSEVSSEDGEEEVVSEVPRDEQGRFASKDESLPPLS